MQSYAGAVNVTDADLVIDRQPIVFKRIEDVREHLSSSNHNKQQAPDHSFLDLYGDEVAGELIKQREYWSQFGFMNQLEFKDTDMLQMILRHIKPSTLDQGVGNENNSDAALATDSFMEAE